jgi:hypothetical protein
VTLPKLRRRQTLGSSFIPVVPALAHGKDRVDYRTPDARVTTALTLTGLR